MSEALFNQDLLLYGEAFTTEDGERVPPDKIGKQRLEIDWDTGDVTDLDPYLAHLFFRLDEARTTAKTIPHAGYCGALTPCSCGARPIPMSGSGELDKDAFMAQMRARMAEPNES